MLSFYVYLRSEFRVCARYDFHIKTMFGSSLPPVVCIFYLRYFCLFAHSDVQHILYCVCVLFVVVLCTLCCQFLWIIHFCPTSTLRIHNVAVWLLFGQVPFLRENYVATTYFRYVICKSLWQRIFQRFCYVRIWSWC